jgi:hypothetical protein
MAASMKRPVFWEVVPCSLVEVHRRFRGAYCPHHQGVHMLEALACTIIHGATSLKTVIFKLAAVRT